MRPKTYGGLLEPSASPSVHKRLLVTQENDGAEQATNSAPALPDFKAAPWPPTQLLDRIKAFLPRMQQANTELETALTIRPPSDFDVEHIEGGDAAPHVAMDLALGVLELRTPEALQQAIAHVGGWSGPGGDDGNGPGDGEVLLPKGGQGGNVNDDDEPRTRVTRPAAKKEAASRNRKKPRIQVL